MRKVRVLPVNDWKEEGRDIAVDARVSGNWFRSVMFAGSVGFEVVRMLIKHRKPVLVVPSEEMIDDLVVNRIDETPEALRNMPLETEPFNGDDITRLT
jgi:hypothetical protein